MESATFHLQSEDIDRKLIKSIKALFKGRRITLTITPEAQEITNPDLIAIIRESEASAYSYKLDGRQLKKLREMVATDVASEEIIDFVKSHKVLK